MPQHAAHLPWSKIFAPRLDRPRFRFIRVGAVAASLLGVAAPLQAGLVSTWVGRGSGNWSVGANWDNGTPGFAGVNGAVINGRRGVDVTLDVNAALESLSIGIGSSLLQPNDRDLSVMSVLNDGLWSMQSVGSHTDLMLNAPVVPFDGAGVLHLGNNPNNRIFSINATRTLANGAGHTIRGAGQVGVNGTVLLNDGVVEATEPSGLTLDASNSEASSNHGVLRARDGATLTIYDSPINNTNGVIRAEADSTVLLRWGSFTGGTFETEGNGQILVSSSEAPILSGVHVLGTLRQSNDGDVSLTGPIVIDGTWLVESVGSHTDIGLDAEVVELSGSGVLSLSNNSNNRLFSLNAARTLILGDGFTMRGAGQVGLNSTKIVNHGLIEATLATTLFVDTWNFGASENHGVLQARDGATLTLYDTVLDNALGVVRAKAGSTVLLRHGSFAGGLFESEGTGEVLVNSSEPPTISDVQIAGVIRQANDGDVTLTGPITNTGLWVMDSVGSHTDLMLNAPIITLHGPGGISMSNNPNNRIYSVNASRTLVNSESHIIGGAGQFGLNNTVFVNDGVIEATLSNGLFVDTWNGAVSDNNGVLRGRAGATLTLYDAIIDNADGVIRAEEASVVLLRYGAINGGRFETGGNGQILVNSGEAPSLNGVQNLGMFRQANDGDVVLIGPIDNIGVWSMDSVGSHTDMMLDAEFVTLNGTGTLALSNNPNNRIYSVNASRTLVNSFQHTIRGAGQLGFNNTRFVNEGDLIADVSVGIFLDVWDNAPSANEGLIWVTDNGAMTIAAGPFENRGTVRIDAGRTLSRTGSYPQPMGTTIVNGTLAMSSGSVSISGGLLEGDGVVQGSVTVLGGSASPSGLPTEDATAIGSLTVNGNYAQQSDGGLVVDLGLSGNDLLEVQGSATLGGALQIRLDGAFTPVPGQEFTVLTATGGISGIFGCVEFPNASAGYFTIVYGPTSVKVIVELAPHQEADLNFDGVVNAADLAILLGAWGNEPCDNAICCPADLNGDGIVNAADLAILLGAWG